MKRLNQNINQKVNNSKSKKNVKNKKRKVRMKKILLILAFIFVILSVLFICKMNENGQKKESVNKGTVVCEKGC